mmetsp:Transcript_19324/g.56245  ORF Transcript_19324/g.56245 Transcript_19324/m.56245 type:complete len:210 (+) Transcript_19324:1309-1938(+)
MVQPGQEISLSLQSRCDKSGALEAVVASSLSGGHEKGVVPQCWISAEADFPGHFVGLVLEALESQGLASPQVPAGPDLATTAASQGALLSHEVPVSDDGAPAKDCLAWSCLRGHAARARQVCTVAGPRQLQTTTRRRRRRRHAPGWSMYSDLAHCLDRRSSPRPPASRQLRIARVPLDHVSRQKKEKDRVHAFRGTWSFTGRQHHKRPH